MPGVRRLEPGVDSYKESLAETGRMAGLVEDGPHLEQLDERRRAIEDAVAFEQRLLFDGIQREVLRERVHELVIGDRGGNADVRVRTLGQMSDKGFEALAHGAQHAHGSREVFRDGLH
jgi:hypothetical protein